MEQLMLQKWEYHVEGLLDLGDLNGVLSRLGHQGWELVGIAGGSSSDSSAPVKTLRRKHEPYHAFFKRPSL